jgi:hypothetical protein
MREALLASVCMHKDAFPFFTQSLLVLLQHSRLACEEANRCILTGMHHMSHALSLCCTVLAASEVLVGLQSSCCCCMIFASLHVCVQARSLRNWDVLH